MSFTAGQPDSSDASDSTVGYAIIGHSGTVDGSMRNDGSVRLAPCDGPLNERDGAGCESVGTMRYSRKLHQFLGRLGLARGVTVGEGIDAQCGEPLDYVYLDGPSEYGPVRDLLRAWYPNVREGGFIGGSSYFDGTSNDAVYGVKTAVDELAAEHGLQIRVTFDGPPAWFCLKPAAGRATARQRIGVLTAYDENLRDLAAWSSPNKRRYCGHHGYEFIERTDGVDPSRPPSWSKILFVKEHLPHFDWLFWTDADSLIMNNAMRLEQFIEDGCDMVLTHDDFGVGKYVVSMGQFLIRSSDWSMRFLDEVWQQTQFVTDRMWEQAAVQFLLEQQDLSEHVCVVTQRRFNSYMHNYRKGDFLLHFAMQPPEARRQLMQVWQQFSVL